MARTWSGRLRSIAARGGELRRELLRLPHRGFLAAAWLVHLSISCFGITSVAARAAAEPAAALAMLTDPSLALFLVTGAFTAVLLLHLSTASTGPAFAGHEPPRLHHQAAVERHRQFLTALTHSEISLPEPPPQARRATGSIEATLTGLMAQVSHEIRTPLNAIIGFSDLMQRELMGPLGSPRYQEYARHIRESGLSVLKAAEETMQLTALLADPEPARPETLDLATAADEACQAAAGEARRRHVKIRRCATGPCSMQADARAMRQALSNLISAAVAHAPERGSVRVRTRVAHGAAHLEIEVDGGCPATDPSVASARLSGKIARVLLELQGAGIEEEELLNGGWQLSAAFPATASPVPTMAARPESRVPVHSTC
jgi:signal transduction histidine kinase